MRARAVHPRASELGTPSRARDGAGGSSGGGPSPAEATAERRTARRGARLARGARRVRTRGTTRARAARAVVRPARRVARSTMRRATRIAARIREGPARGGSLRLEIDHGSREHRGDCGTALGTKYGREGRQGIFGGHERWLKAVGESRHGGHGLLLGGRLVHARKQSLEVEGRRCERLCRRCRGDHHRHLRSDPRGHELLHGFEKPSPEAVGVGLALLQPIATRDEWATHLRGGTAGRHIRISSLARRLDADPGFVEESGHHILL